MTEATNHDPIIQGLVEELRSIRDRRLAAAYDDHEADREMLKAQSGVILRAMNEAKMRAVVNAIFSLTIGMIFPPWAKDTKP